MHAESKSPDWHRTIPFKVDVAGVIHIMGSALYSRPAAAIRELLQNAHDAIVRREKTDLGFLGRIDVFQDREHGILAFEDNGVGLTAEEAEAYLGTLGVGITGLLKGEHPDSVAERNGDTGLIGQFGIGLFSAFMVADEIEVISRKIGQESAVRWRAGAGTDILLSSSSRSETGTTVRLHLNTQFREWGMHQEGMEDVIREFADYLPIPIFLNRGKSRVNVIHSEWFDPTPDLEGLASEFETQFEETPLDVVPVHIREPVPICGALYISPQRTPGFSGEAIVTGTVLRMVVSKRIDDLIPPWAGFLRGVLELPRCRPTASREELVRNEQFEQARQAIENHLFQHFEELAVSSPARMESLLTWHRYLWAGAGLFVPRIRELLKNNYRFQTSRGSLTAKEIFGRSRACPIRDSEFDIVVWFNSDRRQERWLTSLFAMQDVPCVHTFQSFEESLLATMISDLAEAQRVDLRPAHPSSKEFASQIVDARDMEPAEPQWAEFLQSTGATVFCADFREEIPVIAFLNEKHGLRQAFDDIKKQGKVPEGFQRLIDRQFEREDDTTNHVLLNRNHRLVARALEQSTAAPMASVLRLLVLQSLVAAGASVPREAINTQVNDLDWIADALWGKR
jgi:HSP90 family molecular chaperone